VYVFSTDGEYITAILKKSLQCKILTGLFIFILTIMELFIVQIESIHNRIQNYPTVIGCSENV